MSGKNRGAPSRAARAWARRIFITNDGTFSASALNYERKVWSDRKVHARHGRIQLNELSDTTRSIDDDLVNKKVRVVEVEFLMGSSGQTVARIANDIVWIIG